MLNRIKDITFVKSLLDNLYYKVLFIDYFSIFKPIVKI